MVFNVIQGGRDAFNTFFYPPPSTGIIDYLNNGLTRAAELVNDYSNAFMNKVYTLYNYYNSNDAIERSKLNLLQCESVIRDDVIYPVPVENLGNANYTMQRYIMAHPKVMELYNKNMCNGFSDTYVDADDHDDPMDNHEYCEAMNGVIQFDEDGNGYYEQIVSVGIDGKTDDLDLMDQVFIWETWDNVMESIALGIDPTDPNKGKL